MIVEIDESKFGKMEEVNQWMDSGCLLVLKEEWINLFLKLSIKGDRYVHGGRLTSAAYWISFNNQCSLKLRITISKWSQKGWSKKFFEIPQRVTGMGGHTE